MKRIITLGAALAAFAGLAACGAAGSSAAQQQPVGAPGAAPSATALPAAPGAVTIGSADFSESELLAYLYGDAMKAHGVRVTEHPDIGERPTYIAALRDGSIGAVPEYTGALLSNLSKNETATTPQAVYGRLQQVARGQGFAVTGYAKAQDVDTITVTRATAAKYHLSSIADLSKVAGKLSLGAPAPLLTVPYGVPALKKVYGVAFQRFVSLSASGTVIQTALRDGTIDAADIFSTDPSITRYGLVSLADPRNIFAAENVVPVFRRGVLTQPMAAACDAVSAKLSTATLGGLVAKVAAGASAETVAAQWISQQGLSQQGLSQQGLGKS